MDVSYANEDFKELYFKCWAIEVKYNQLKSRYNKYPSNKKRSV